MLARVEVLKGEIFQLALDAAHAEAVGDGGVDLHRLLGDGHPLLLREVLEGAHVVEAVGQLDQHHAEVGDHGQEHLPEGLGLLLLLRDVGIAGDLGDAVDEVGDVRAEGLLQRLLGGQRIFQHVVQEPDGDGGLVEAHLGQDVGDVERVDKIRLARAAHLSAMLARRKNEGAVEQLLIEVRLVSLDFVEDVFEAEHGWIVALGALALGS